MVTYIIKRDGREVPFNADKIEAAIYKAFVAMGRNDKELASNLSQKVVIRVNEVWGEKDNIPTVEEIQDTVEQILMENGHPLTAKRYILYRADRTKKREMNTTLMKTLEDITYKSAKESDIKRENANIDGDTAMGTMLKYGSEAAKEFYEKFIIKPEVVKAHKSGDIHIHDMDFYTLTTTCCQIDIVDLFKNGFCTGHGFLREPKHIASYSALACIAIQSNQNDQHGGQSIVNFDYGMAIGVAKTYAQTYKANIKKTTDILIDEETGTWAADLVDSIHDALGLLPTLGGVDEYNEIISQKMKEKIADDEAVEKILEFVKKNSEKETDRATYQAMEALIHNLNTMHSRAGAQIPFSSINYGMDTSPEGRMVMKNVLLATEAGLGNGETAIFPIQIFRVKEGINFNPGEPNYDLFKLSCRVSAKRLFPNFSFQDAPFNISYYKEGHPETEIAYMGCRTRVIGNAYDKSQEISYRRGNLSFTSINLPRLGIKSHGNANIFFEMLEKELDLVCDQLYSRYLIQASKKVRNYPFLMGQGVWLGSENLGPDDTLETVLKHGTLSVGFIGLAECLKALTGKHHGESPESQNLGLEIIGYMRSYLDDKSKRTKMNYTLLATPAEGLSGRFVRLDKKEYGIIPGVTDREYYTNSFHIPVYYDINAFEKINLEAPYHALTNAGHITYVELDGDPTQNLEVFEKIVRHMEKVGIGYGSINHPVDRDPACGYTGIIGDECPNCGRKEEDGEFERIRRITGYLVGTLDRFNNAKRAEERDRVKHYKC